MKVQIHIKILKIKEWIVSISGYECSIETIETDFR
jgi:hypothetical protein